MIASMPVHKARALLRIAADVSDHRHYIQGFWLEPSGVAVATDGSCLLAIRGVHVDFQGPPVLIPRAVLEPFLKGKAATDTLVIERGALRIGDTSVACYPREAGDAATGATYPNWRRTIPQGLTGRATCDGKNGVEYSCLDSRILERLRVALGELSAKSPAKAAPVFPMFNGTSACMLATGDDVLAIVMPMRTGKGFDIPTLNAHAASWSAQSDKPARELPTTPADIESEAT